MPLSRVLLVAIAALLIGFGLGAVVGSSGGVERKALDSMMRENALLRQKAELLERELADINAALEGGQRGGE